nr:PREDICTED: leucine-, glutamate- and lysine-rich protein 1 isoform X3 [Lepisosteus oculatus]
MDHNETVCKYCGVSYLIHHEFQLMEEKVKAMEAELEFYRGSVEREKRLQQELQGAGAHLERLKTEQQQQSESLKALSLQVAERQTQLECVTTDMSVAKRKLEEAESQCQALRSKCYQQHSVMKKTLYLLQTAKQELMTLRSIVSDFSDIWRGFNTELLKRSKDTDTDITTLQEAVAAARQETEQLQKQVKDLQSDLASSTSQRHQLQATAQREAELQTEMLELNNQIKTLQLDLQERTSERDRLEQVFTTISREIEDHRYKQIQFEKEQKDVHARLCRELRDKEESWLTCQQQVRHLQEQLSEWERKEKDRVRQNSRTENENATLRAALKQAEEEITMLKSERETTVLSHQSTIQQLLESFRQKMVDAEYLRSQVREELENERAKLSLHLKENELSLRREASVELDIERQKFQELLLKYQHELEELRKKVPDLVLTATQELKAEVLLLEEKLREAHLSLTERDSRKEEEIDSLRKVVSALENQLAHEKHTIDHLLSEVRQEAEQKSIKLSAVTKELEQLTQESSQLQEENSLLQETVRRECEERYELTEALSLAREQLLELTQLGRGLQLSRHSVRRGSLASTPPSAQSQGQRSGSSSRGSEMQMKRDSVTRSSGCPQIAPSSWLGSGSKGIPPIPLPHPPRGSASSMRESRQRIAAAIRRPEKMIPWSPPQTYLVDGSRLPVSQCLPSADLNGP